MSWWIWWSDGSVGCVELTHDEMPTKGSAGRRHRGV